MFEIKVCRICLSFNSKLYKYHVFNLKCFYEEITASKVTMQDSLPKYFCYECAAMLYKYHKFKNKCLMGEKVLKDISKKESITYNSIKEIDRISKNLQSSLGVIVINKRIKTFIMENGNCTPKHTEPIQDIVIPNETYSDTDSIYDSNYSDVEIGIEKIEIKENIVIDDEKIGADTAAIIQNSENVKTTDFIKLKIPKLEEDSLNEENIPIAQLNEYLLKDKVDEDNIAIFDGKKKRYIQIKDKKLKNSNKKKPKNKNMEPNANKFKIENRREKFLDSNNWEKLILTEEEAEKEFRAKSEDPKYLKMPFKCELCYKGFSKEDMLNRHVKLRHNESTGEISCRYCGMRFKWVCFLRRHMRQHYTKYKCLRCDLVCYRETTALFHEEYHNGVIRKCEHCGEEFKHSSTYYTHLRTHRSEHVCTLCGASFVSEAGVHRHKLLKHIEQDNEPPKENEQVNTYCERCDVKFETGKAYQKHLIHSAMHTDGVEDLVGDLPAPSNPKRRRKFIKRNHRKPTTCNKCGEHFGTQKDFIKHHLAAHPGLAIILPKERHICEVCGISLAGLEEAMSIIVEDTDDGLEYDLTIIPPESSVATDEQEGDDDGHIIMPVSMSSHMNTHTRQQRFTCATCGLQVYSKGSLTRHQLTHTDERPYPCSLCEKKFKQKCSMQLHYRTLHLKQPYPKRNRKKRTRSDEVPLTDYRSKASDDNVAIVRWR